MVVKVPSNPTGHDFRRFNDAARFIKRKIESLGHLCHAGLQATAVPAYLATMQQTTCWYQRRHCEIIFLARVVTRDCAACGHWRRYSTIHENLERHLIETAFHHHEFQRRRLTPLRPPQLWITNDNAASTSATVLMMIITHGLAICARSPWSNDNGGTTALRRWILQITNATGTVTSSAQTTVCQYRARIKVPKLRV